MRIGVLGGTFDPPHLGHLILAELARDQLELDRLLWIPAADPPHKQGIQLSAVEHRLEMVRRCIADNKGFEVSLVDVARPGPHYSVDMLARLGDEFPDAAFYFMIGGDSLRDLPLWHDPARLISQAELVVMSRSGAAYDMDSLEAALPGISRRLTFLTAPLIEISGRDIRQRAREKRSIRYLVADPVYSYILLHSLYQDDTLE